MPHPLPAAAAIALLLACAGCQDGVYRAYDGPARPAERVARLAHDPADRRPLDDRPRLISVDGRGVWPEWVDVLELAPGPHELAYKFHWFMNRAMWQQRTHSLYSERVRRGDDVHFDAIDISENRTWYPFQMAFVLLNLPGITKLDHEARSESQQATADLLFFPTGGGKTEAYLGLSAYTIALRRLQGTVEGRNGENGIAVLMRYTLRLLTVQQFQRAAALQRRRSGDISTKRWSGWDCVRRTRCVPNTSPRSTAACTARPATPARSSATPSTASRTSAKHSSEQRGVSW
jgi:hypothetical protein